MQGRPKTYPFPVTLAELEHLEDWTRMAIQQTTRQIAPLHQRIQGLLPAHASTDRYNTAFSLFLSKQDGQIIRRVLDQTAATITLHEEGLHLLDALNYKLQAFLAVVSYLEQEKR